MRVENWHSKLLAYIDQQERIPFAYGVNDCLLMVAGAVEAITGIDHAEAFRGRYGTLAEGRALIGKTPLSFVKSKLREHDKLSDANDGDVAAVRENGQWAFGIFIGPHIYVQIEAGLGTLRRSDAEKAFRVD